MYKRSTITLSALVALALLLSACGILPAVKEGAAALLDNDDAESQVLPASQPRQHVEDSVVQSDGVADIDSDLLAAYQSTLSEIYERVNPSVVNIQVTVDAASMLPEGFQMPDLPDDDEDSPFFNMPGFPGLPEVPEGGHPFGMAMGSGFVWDEQGHIVSNNHVVGNAKEIEVIFSDGTRLPATLVGADPDSDLAVIKVDAPNGLLRSVQIGDSEALRVGQLAIAIGNPFGLDGTMTTGIISALGRSLPAGSSVVGGASYSIPDIIQTDAPINPGNSGGVLLDVDGNVIGVNTAIESSTGSNSGIGFAVPSAIVLKVVPNLIKDGSYAHPYLGISGTSLTPNLAKEMGLDSSQRGALVSEVVEDGPASKAELRGSDRQVTINGQPVNVGGDVIVAIEGQEIREMGDLIAFLVTHAEVGQKVELTLLRDGKEMNVSVTLGARPSRPVAQVPAEEQQDQEQAQPRQGRVFLGILGMPLNSQVAQAMDLPEDQQGVLVVSVEPGAPAEKAGLQGSDQPATIDGQEVMIGGDVIIALDGESVTTVEELSALLQETGAGTEVTLTVLRDGKTIEIKATLAARPE